MQEKCFSQEKLIASEIKGDIIHVHHPDRFTFTRFPDDRITATLDWPVTNSNHIAKLKTADFVKVDHDGIECFIEIEYLNVKYGAHTLTNVKVKGRALMVWR